MKIRGVYIFVFSLLLFFFALPLLSVINCTSWSNNAMIPDACFIDSPEMRELVGVTMGWAFVSSFLAGIPILIYFGLLYWISSKIYTAVFNFQRILEKDRLRKKDMEKVKLSIRLLFVPRSLWARGIFTLWLLFQVGILVAEMGQEKLGLFEFVTAVLVNLIANFILLAVLRWIYFYNRGAR